jgi:PAS domain S-box-containing protein
MAASLFRAIRDSVIFTDLEGRIRYWSEGAEAVFGHRAEAVLGRTLDFIYPLPDPGRIARDMARILAGEDHVGEWTGRHRDGRSLLLDVRTTVVRGDDGAPVGFLGIARDITERRAGDERLHRVLDSLFVFVGVLDVDGVLLEANRAPVEAAGLAPEDVLGKRFEECWWWSYDEGVQAQLLDAMARARAGEVVRYDVPVRMAGGRLMPIDFMIAPLRDAGGRITHLVPSAVDITDRTAKEAELRASEAGFRGLAESMPAVVFTTNADGRTEYINQRWAEVSGRPASDSLGLGWLAHVHPDDRARAAETWERHRAEGTPYALEYRLGTEGDEWRWHLVRVVPVRVPGGPLRWIGTATDVHEQRLLREELARERAFVESVLATAPVALCVLDTEFRFVRANDVVAAMNGLPVSAHIGRTVADVVPHLWPQVAPIYRQVLEAGEPVLGLEVSGTLPSDPAVERTWLGNYYPVRQGGAITGLGVALVEITAQKRAEQALRRADRRKDEFLATLAHELRNPLSPIRSAVQLLRPGVSTPEEVGWSRDLIDRQVSHLARLIDDLIDVSRISQGRLVLRRAPTTLGDVVRAAVETSRPLLEQRRHALAVDVAAEPLALDADPVRLAQAVTNLLNNAAKYTPPGGRVELAVRREREEGVVEVRDDGIGITAEHLPHVFEMFYQTDVSLERSSGGLGIGLGLVREIVELHGGRVAAVSEGPGRGSAFTIRVPLVARERPASAPRPAPAPVRARRMLVVDDNEDGALALAELLRLSGHEVDVAHDGHAALEAADRTRPEVILLDIGMPGLNGYDACRALRARPWGREALVVAQTGWGQAEDRARAAEAGFDAHFVKPVDLGELLRLVAARRP